MIRVQNTEIRSSFVQRVNNQINVILNLMLLPWKTVFFLMVFLWIAIYFSGNLGDGQNFIWTFQSIGLYPHLSYVILMSIILSGVLFAVFNFLFAGLGKAYQVVARKLAQTSAGRWVKRLPYLPTLALIVGGAAFVSFILMVNLSGRSYQPVPVLRIPTKPAFPKINRVLLDMNGHMISGNARIVQIAKGVYQVRMKPKHD
jgi:hypothetical protein